MKVLKMFIVLTLVISTTAPAFAGFGQALVPGIHARYDSTDYQIHTRLTLTNITDNTLSGTIKLYQHDGTLFYDTSSGSADIQAYYFASYSEGTTSAPYTATFTMNANTTCTIVIYMKGTVATNFDGYAKIDWENVTGDDVYGLVANGDNYFLNRLTSGEGLLSRHAIPINMGMPF